MNSGIKHTDELCVPKTWAVVVNILYNRFYIIENSLQKMLVLSETLEQCIQ